jgi:hypothetical protein
VPIDLRALAAVRSSLAVDAFCWLTYRLAALSSPLVLSWPELAIQFGSQTARPRDFRRDREVHHLVSLATTNRRAARFAGIAE